MPRNLTANAWDRDRVPMRFKMETSVLGWRNHGITEKLRDGYIFMGSQLGEYIGEVFH